jgi:F-type H+-transporting ATPase subunit epsilon
MPPRPVRFGANTNMAETFKIEIATPEKLVVTQDAEYAHIPGKDGYMGILPGHAALLSELGQGELTYTLGGKTEACTVSGGYVEVRDNHVRVLADSVE